MPLCCSPIWKKTHPTRTGLEEVMPKALAKSPEDRYQSGRELVDAARSGLGIAEPSHNRWPLVLAVIGVALIGAALLTVFLTRGGAGGPTTAGRVMAIDPATNKVRATATGEPRRARSRRARGESG